MVVQSEMVDVAQQSGLSGWWAGAQGGRSQFPAAVPADSPNVWMMGSKNLPVLILDLSGVSTCYSKVEWQTTTIRACG